MEARGTILVVDDDQTIVSLCQAALETAGLRILVASSGQEAKQALDSNDSIGVLVTDINMPDINGPDLVEEILPTRPHLRVLYISGAWEQEKVNRHLEELGCRLLRKPFAPAALIAEVRRMLERFESSASQQAPRLHCAFRSSRSQQRKSGANITD